jgi:hypothetical protein
MAIFAKNCKNRQIVKALNFKGFERYLRCIFATTSMCVVFDRKNKKSLDRPKREKYSPAGQI